MKNHNMFAIVLVLAASAVTVSALLAEPATRPAGIGVGRDAVTTREFLADPENRRPTRRIRITWNPLGISFDRKTIIGALSSPGSLVRGLPEKIQKRMGSNDLAEVRFTPILGSDESATRRGFLIGDYQMIFRYSSKEAPGSEVLEAVVGQLWKMLREEYKESINHLGSKYHEAIDTRNKAQARLRVIRGGLVTMATDAIAGTDITWKEEKNRALISELESQLQRLEIEMAAKRMRYETVRDQIAEIGRAVDRKSIIEELEQKKKIVKELLEVRMHTEKHPAVESLRAKIALLEADLKKSEPTAASPVKDEPIAEELEKIVEARKIRFKQVMLLEKRGKATSSELAQAEAALADAKIQLARRREEVLRSSGGLELATRLKAEQTALMIDIREMEARAAVARNQMRQARRERKELLAKLRDREAAIMKMEHVKTVDLPLAVKQYERAALRADELRQKLQDVVPPTVTIVK